MANNKKNFIFKTKVYYEDTDAGGIVYHANYLKFFERARTEFIYSLGFNHKLLKEKYNSTIIVHKFNIVYRKPALFEDDLMIITTVKNVSKLRIEMFQNAFNKKKDLLTEAFVELVNVNIKGKPTSLPKELFDQLNK
jgi:acyl-CoA thioester hydrolase